MFDYPDPGTDPERCDALSTDPADELRFQCMHCGDWTEDETCWPYCSPECVAGVTAEDSEELERVR